MMQNNKSRVNNAKLNIFIGIFVQVIATILSFVSRKLFVLFLDVEYLGVNGLYTNILSVLSLAELGLGSVVMYSLYKPVAEDNRPLIRSLLQYFRKLYSVIAIVVMAIGVLLIPFLKFIVTSDLPENDLIVYYLLFLVNSVVSYFVAHKIALLAANQENRIQKLVTLGTTLLLQLIHIGVLLLYPNYMLYVCASIVVTIIGNCALGWITDKRYRYIRDNDDIPVVIDKVSIKTNIKSTAVYKFSIVLLNNTQNILISVMVSTLAVGLYSNYLIIVTALQAFLSIVTSSLSNSVGNLNAANNKDRLLSIFRMLVFAYHLISYFCAICMYFVFNDFITIWLGSAYHLDTFAVFAIAFNFYLTNLLTPIWSFREATGQFVKAKYIMTAAALLNIMFAFPLGRFFGVGGILIATSVSKLLTMVWYEPRILFRHIFLKPQRLYWAQQFRYTLSSIVASALCFGINGCFASDMLSIVLKCVCFFFVCALAFILPNYRADTVKGLKAIAINQIFHIRK